MLRSLLCAILKTTVVDWLFRIHVQVLQILLTCESSIDVVGRKIDFNVAVILLPWCMIVCGIVRCSWSVVQGVLVAFHCMIGVVSEGEKGDFKNQL